MKKNELANFFKKQIDEHLFVADKCKDLLSDPFFKSVNICVDCLKKKKKILLFGNGGSASDAQHLSTELTVRFSKNRSALAAISLATDTSALTAISNDFGYKYVFSRQLEAIGEKDDVAIGITTSGKSENVIIGLEKAQKRKMKCIALTGNFTKKLEKCSDEIGQMLCNAIEYGLGLAPLVKEEK